MRFVSGEYIRYSKARPVLMHEVGEVLRTEFRPTAIEQSSLTKHNTARKCKPVKHQDSLGKRIIQFRNYIIIFLIFIIFYK